MEDDDSARELFEEVERRAFIDLPEEDVEDEVDLLAEFGEPGPEVDTSAARDMTLGGYIELHNRPPAFGGRDQQPYTVDIDVEETGEAERPYAAFLVFLRWAETGAGIMEHTESGDVAFGDTPAAARAAALELTLYEIKAELDAAIERKRRELED
ncbi:MAG: hypothetical protein ACT443_11095 [Gemmatimonadota bacterium]